LSFSDFRSKTLLILQALSLSKPVTTHSTLAIIPSLAMTIPKITQAIKANIT